MDKAAPLVSPRKPLQKRSLQKVEAILAAARRLIEQDGIEQLTAILVAREAGVPVGSVYFYFPSPMAMVEALAEQWLASLRAAFTALPGQTASPGHWEALLDALLHITYGEPSRMGERRFELQMTKALDFYPELQTVRQHHADEVARLMAELLAGAGARWPKERLLRLARYGYELIGALDNYLQQETVDPVEAFAWTRQALTAVVGQCFSGAPSV